MNESGTGMAAPSLPLGEGKQPSGPMLRYLGVVVAMSMLVACRGPARPAVVGPGAGSSVQEQAIDENRPAQPLDKELTAPRGGIMVTLSNWVLRYEGTITDGRPRFLESVWSGDAKDVVFDPQRSELYPFGDYGIKILRYDPDSVNYVIETTD